MYWNTDEIIAQLFQGLFFFLVSSFILGNQCQLSWESIQKQRSNTFRKVALNPA